MEFANRCDDRPLDFVKLFTNVETTTYERYTTMTVLLAPAKETPAKPTFLYDDCCPLCRSYTATFSALGWADRAAFSQVDETLLQALDVDTARHQIPLHDARTGDTQYGLDGILGIVSARAPILGAMANAPIVRSGLDRLYWFITYNRRHIVAAPPPVDGFDCAPDFEPAAVRAYICFCAATSAALAPIAGTAGLAGAAFAGAALVADRDQSHGINNMQAAGHAGSVAAASAIAGAAVKIVTGQPVLATAAAVATAARKTYLRRWMRKPRAARA